MLSLLAPSKWFQKNIVAVVVEVIPSQKSGIDAFGTFCYVAVVVVPNVLLPTHPNLNHTTKIVVVSPLNRRCCTRRRVYAPPPNQRPCRRWNFMRSGWVVLLLLPLWCSQTNSTHLPTSVYLFVCLRFAASFFFWQLLIVDERRHRRCAGDFAHSPH